MSELEIARCGIVCSLGRSPTQVAALLRAGHFDLRLTPFTSHGQRVRACQLWDLPADCVGFERMKLLASCALRQVVAHGSEGVSSSSRASGELSAGSRDDAGASDAWRSDEPGEATALLLTLPSEGRPDDDPELAASFASRLAESCGIVLDRERSKTLRGGHSAGIALLEHAVELIAHHGLSRVVVGGVDSYYHPALLEQLDEQDRLFGWDSAEGIIPGEAAAFLVLQKASAHAAGSPSKGEGDARGTFCGAPRLSWARAGRIPDDVWNAVYGKADETAVDDSDASGSTAPPPGAERSRLRSALNRLAYRHGLGRWWPSGSGARAGPRKPSPAAPEAVPVELTHTMQQLVEAATSAAGGTAPKWVLTDLNHDRERGEQWTTVWVRSLGPDAHCSHFMRQLGDTGAASVAVLANVACGMWSLGAAPASNALLAVHSDDADRGVALLRQPP